MIRSLLTCCVIAMLLCLPARAAWMGPQGGQIPPNALVAGQGSNGQPLYVCRAQYGVGIYPGTLAGASTDCSISYDGSEQKLPDYEVLVDEGYSWVSTYNGEIPFDALPVGAEKQDDIVYICRGEVDSQWRPGKIRHANSACLVSYRGKELKAPWYEVLVGN